MSKAAFRDKQTLTGKEEQRGLYTFKLHHSGRQWSWS